MKIGVTHKLFLAILAAAGLAVVSSAMIMQWSLSRGFLRFVNSMEKSGISRLAARLEERYRDEQGWESLRQDPELWRRFIAVSLPETPPREEHPLQGQPPHDRMKPLPPHMLRHFDRRLFLLDADRKVLISHVEAPVDKAATPLRHQGRIVGYLGLLPRTNISDPPQLRFLKEQKLSFALVAAVVVILAAGLSLLLARRLVQPLACLAQATHRLAAGSFDVRVPVTTNDELGQLSGDFNALAITLEKNEQARRQWVADISHELRTPVSVLQGEIEAIQDGVRPFTPEAARSLHNEILRLGRLVEDLHQLAMTDIGALAYRKAATDLALTITDAVESYWLAFHERNIDITTELAPPGTTLAWGDNERLRQLFCNLLDNSLKYTDPGGMLEIRITAGNGKVRIDFDDSGPGVPGKELDRLFERLYRVESSRSRSTGGAGLGLSICRNIVEAHGGEITAHPSPLGGVRIRIEVPSWRG